MTVNRKKQIIEISGAGPAGLAAALAIAHAGGHAHVYERCDDVGTRFQDDFQGLENWTTEKPMCWKNWMKQALSRDSSTHR